MTGNDSNISYRSASKIYGAFDKIISWGGKGNPRLGLLDALGNAPPTILDVCVGTAASAMLVATHFPHSHILGVDISDDMLAVAQRHIRQNGLANLEVKHMPAQSLALADGSFDAVMISFALHEFEPALRDKIFSEMARVLKPGGTLCVIDFARQDDWRNRLFLNVWTLIEPACFAGFLAINWRTHLEKYGLRYESEKEYSFSRLYVWRKA